MSKPDARWEAYKSRVPGLDAQLQPPVVAQDDADLEFRQLVASLPEEVAEAIQATVPLAAEPDWSQAIEHRWCLCEMAEGDFPRVRLYATVQGLTEAIAKREGQETAVWAMYGVPLRLTQALTTGDNQKLRYLLLPNQLAAPVSTSGEFRLVTQESLPENLETEEDGWLGDPTYFSNQRYYLSGYTDTPTTFIAEPEEPDEDDDLDSQGA